MENSAQPLSETPHLAISAVGLGGVTGMLGGTAGNDTSAPLAAKNQRRAAGKTWPPAPLDDAVRAPAALADRLLMMAINAFASLLHPRLVWSFRRRLGFWPNIARPRTTYEKYLWRKLFDRAPWQRALSDKLKAKEFVRSRLPGLRIPRTLWVGGRIAECPAEVLAGNVAVKANHGCEFNFFVKGGRVDNIELARQTERWLAIDYGRRQGQWAYRGIKPRLFAEELLVDGGTLVDREFKVYVTGGRAVYTYVCYDRFEAFKASDILDRDGAPLPGAADVGTPRRNAAAPAEYPEMIAAAEALGRDFDLVRCDLYLHQGEIWFSEITVYSAGGYAWVEDFDTMKALNRAWDIGKSWFLTAPQRGWRAVYAAALRRAVAR